MISTSYIKIILMVLWFCSLSNVFCSWIFLFVLFILWKGVEGARWRGVACSQFIFCAVSLLGSLCFTHLSNSVLWNQDASFELQINLGWHLFLSALICIYIIGVFNPENKSTPWVNHLYCVFCTTECFDRWWLHCESTSVELSYFSDAEWCHWRLFFEVTHLAALVSLWSDLDNMLILRMCWELLGGSSSAKWLENCVCLHSHACTVASLPEYTGIKAC